MKRLLLIAGFVLASLVGAMSAAQAATVTACANVNVNGQGTGGPVCHTITAP